MEEKKKKPKTNGARNRRKGHNAERKRAIAFRELGFEHCKTSREASRLLDNCQVDLAFIPYNVQIKAVVGSINYKKVFTEMKELLDNNYPKHDPQGKWPSIIIHDRGRTQSDKLVVMQEHDFFELLKIVHKND